MKKLLIVCAVLFACCAVYAQKTLEVCVAENLSAPMQRDNDSRTCNLVAEYFKSELATHSSISIIQSQELTNDKLTKKGFKRGSALDPKLVSALCKEQKADYVCFISLTHNKKFDAVVNIYDAAGVKKGEYKRPFDSVRNADAASIMLARDAAIAIRGHNPVDDVHMLRMKKQRDQLKEPSVGKQRDITVELNSIY